jgi:hypothetical protein
LNSNLGLHVPCQAATHKVATLPFIRERVPPATDCAEDPGKPADPREYAADSSTHTGAASKMPRACADETDADRPFFMHALE